MSLDPLAGLELDGHRLGEVIGRGGMGIVYRAEDASGEVVAIKVIAPELARSAEFRQRFLREADSALDHPNIVPIYSAGEHEGHLFMKMRLVDGPDLKKLIEAEGPMSQSRAASLMAQAAQALDFAHSSLLVHRDIKPQNLLIESPGDGDHVFLTDFGLVKRVSTDSSFTSSGHIVGSAPYMAPEQIKGAGVDGRSDVYALGCVLYECLTGVPPYRREEEVSILWAHVNEPPPKPSDEVGVLGDRIDAVVAKAMAKDADERYLTAGDLAAALAAEAGASTVGARSPWVGPRIARSQPKRTRPSAPDAHIAPRRGSLRGVALIAATLMISGLAIAGPMGQSPRLADQLEAAAESSEQPSDLGSEGATDKGRRSRRQGGAGYGVPALEEPLLAGGLDDLGSSGSLVGAATRRASKATGAAARAIVPASSAAASSRIVFTSNRAYPVDQRQPYSSMDLYSMNADGSNLRKIFSDGSDSSIDRPEVSACGDLITIQRPESGLTSTWMRIYRGVSKVQYGPAQWGNEYPFWTPDCQSLVYEREGTSEVWAMDRDGSNRREFWRGGFSPSVSPNGRKLAFANVSSSTSEDIYLADLTQPSVPRKLTTTTRYVFFGRPVWSPDGKRIAFSRRDGSGVTSRELWVMDADGSNQRKVAGDATRILEPITWSPDGSYIVYHRRDTAAQGATGGDIYVIRPNGTGARDLIPDAGGDEGWLSWQSPVFRTISLDRVNGGIAGRIKAILPACGREQEVVIERAESGAWRAIGKVTTRADGRFGASVGDGKHRARLLLSDGAGGLICGIATSKAR